MKECELKIAQIDLISEREEAVKITISLITSYANIVEKIFPSLSGYEFKRNTNKSSEFVFSIY